MESLFNKYQINQNKNNQTDHNSSLGNKNLNSFSNIEFNFNDDNCNSISIFNNIKDKEEISLSSYPKEKINNLLIPHKRIKTKNKQASERNLTRKDNMQRLCKHLVLENLMDFINNKIKLAYEGKIGSGLFKKEILKIKQTQKLDYHIDFNKDFLNKSIKDIFSENITNRITYYDKDHNKKVIDELIKEKADEFEKLFNITFIDCVEHFSGINYIPELKGLKLYTELKEYIINKYSKNDESFYYNLEKFIKDYRRIIKDSNPRNKKNKK